MLLCGSIIPEILSKLPSNNIIYIDESLPENEKTFVLAHELGHMLLHKKTNALFLDTRTQLKTYRYEKEANTFAAELLIPDSLILEHPGYTKSQLARLAGYNEIIMEFKKLNQSQMQSLP